MKQIDKRKKIYIKLKSLIRIYIVVWMAFIIVTFLIINLLKPLSESEITYIILGYILSVFLLIVFIIIYEGNRFNKFLKENYYEKWCEITSFLGVPGGVNSYRFIKFIYSKETFNDPLLSDYKKMQKKLNLLLPIMFLSLPIISFVIMFIYFVQNV